MGGTDFNFSGSFFLSSFDRRQPSRRIGVNFSRDRINCAAQMFSFAACQI